VDAVVAVSKNARNATATKAVDTATTTTASAVPRRLVAVATHEADARTMTVNAHPVLRAAAPPANVIATALAAPPTPTTGAPLARADQMAAAPGA
jgi:hypothetical protein